MPQLPEDTIGSLEHAREHLYESGAVSHDSRVPLSVSGERSVPHTWEKIPLQKAAYIGKRHMRLASIFFIIAFLFFIISLGIAGYFFYFGSNSVSTDKISVDIQGQSVIAGGDTIPLSLTITNKNATSIENATIEIDFPNGTRNASDVLSEYPRYIENLGQIASGATVTRSIKVILFGGAGQALSLPVSFSYGTAASNSVFVKKSAYALMISSTPLSVSVDAPSDIVSGEPFTFTLTVNSNATVPLNNVVLTAAFPFGFSVTSSSLHLNNSSFLIGSLLPNASKTITLTGSLLGQASQKSVFHFTVGVAKTAQDQTASVTYMTQDATVAIAAPFITTILAVNGNTSPNSVLTSGSLQNVTVSYTNTLTTSIQNATVSVALSGSAVDYNSINSTSGFYRSADHTIIFSKDTDFSIANLAPGASGIGTFTFSTLPSGSLPTSPAVTFTTSVSGIPAGQTNVIEAINTSATRTEKVVTTVVLSSSALHNSGSFSNSGPIPPRADQATTYTIVWNVHNEGSPVAGGTISTILPSYVSYIDNTAGNFLYNNGSRAVSWNTGDLAQGASANGAFQVSLTPSTSQSGSAPNLTGTASFSGYDRFAGVQVSANADAVTTETKEDPGYIGANAIVQ